MIAAPIGGARVSVVDVRDIAATAAAALTDDGHKGHVYTLTGPEALTHGEMATKLADVAGREVRFQDSSEEDFRQAICGAGMPDWKVEGLMEGYAHYRREEAADLATGVRDATGQEPRTFDAFAYYCVDAFKRR